MLCPESVIRYSMDGGRISRRIPDGDHGGEVIPGWGSNEVRAGMGHMGWDGIWLQNPRRKHSSRMSEGDREIAQW